MLYLLESAHHELVCMISYPNSGSNFGLDFTKGLRLSDGLANGQLLIDFESDHESLPDYFEVDGMPIVSESFLSVWRTIPADNYQVFPISTRFPKGLGQPRYLINIIGRFACFDLERGEYKMYEGLVSRVKKLVIRENVGHLPDVFRADEYPLAIFISERVKNILGTSNLSGLVISESLNWNDRYRF